MNVIIDIESNTYELHLLSDIWMVCIYDASLPSDESSGACASDGESWTLYSAESFFEWLERYQPETIIGHNILGFDLPALRRLWQVDYNVGKADSINGVTTRFVDTFQLSSFLYPDRLGGHSLDNLASLSGGATKGSHTDWTKASPEMEAYCLRDCRATAGVLKYLMREIEARRA